jgi:proton-translocating NADH-quinone oxidoreductase chain M
MLKSNIELKILEICSFLIGIILLESNLISITNYFYIVTILGIISFIIKLNEKKLDIDFIMYGFLIGMVLLENNLIFLTNYCYIITIFGVTLLTIKPNEKKLDINFIVLFLCGFSIGIILLIFNLMPAFIINNWFLFFVFFLIITITENDNENTKQLNIINNFFKINFIEIYKLNVLYIFLLLFIIMNIIWLLFDELTGCFQYNLIISNGNLLIRFGIDAISFYFMYLTSFLISLTMLFSFISRNTWKEKKNNIFLLFTVGILLIIVFYVLDLLIFYISFEAILVPFFVYIGVTGYRKRRIHAAYLFFFYTLVGSFFMLVSIFFIYLYVGSTDLEILWNIEWIGNLNYLLWIALFLTFAIKVPMFPFHIWLPEAHVEAPTEGSVLLAGLLLKLGTYGFMRFLFPLFPQLNYYFSPLIIMIASIGIIYTSFATLRQIDIKRIIAYSSIAHMNMCILGLFSYNEVALIGSIFLMIAHGIVSGGLFFIIGILYNRFRTKIIHYFSGVIHFMPVMCFFFFLLLLGNIGMPGTSNFVGELLIITGIMYQGYTIGLISGIIGIFLCTVYSMWMYNKVIFLLPKFYYVIIPDLYFFEIIILTPLIIMMLFLGISPISLFSLLDFSIVYNWIELLN